MDTARLLLTLKALLGDAFGSRLDKVVIFGSLARGNADPESDVDVLVVLAPPFDLGRDLEAAIEATSALQLNLDRCIHLVPAPRDAYDAGYYALYRNAQREGLAA